MISSIVETKKGRIGGIAMDGCVVYRGIRYAKAPVGELRFKAPVETDAWEGVYEAIRWGNISPQADLADMPLYGREFYSQPEFTAPCDEDCLFLNIWTPADSKGKKLPVAFWIHGGAFDHGWGFELEFDGASFCRQNVILVTINYRVGVLGFLAHSWLSERENGRSGNYGCLDQIAALKWVRDNIEAFGGDPDNITVFGQSAGCMSAQVLTSTDLTRGWISKCILQSAPAYPSPMLSGGTLAEAEEKGAALIRNAGISSLEELLAVPASVLVKAQQEAGVMLPPVIDGFVQTASGEKLLEEGHFHDIPYMAGCTADDIFGDDCRKLVSAWCAKKAEKGTTPVYQYFFRRALPGDDAGSFHSAELWYVFGTLKRCWRPMTEADEALSCRMVSAWTSFMKTGTPGWDAAPFTEVLDI